MNKLDIIGQENVLFYLQERMKTNSLPNTMLFTGPSGVGKTTMAKRVAIDIVDNISENDIGCVITNQDTETIKFFNMSILKSDEEVKRVISNFTPPLAGKKVLILDECHGMTNQQQDALLIQLENLDKSIYVIMCTTDAYRLNESLVGRIDITLRFSSLSKAELRLLCTKLCDEYNLNFDFNKQEAISQITLYSNGDARILQKTMLELFNLKTVITQKHLDALLGDVGIIQPVMLLKMITTDVAQSLQFTDNLVLDFTFRNKCAKLLSLYLGTRDEISINEQKLLATLYPKYKQVYIDFLCEILNDTSIDIPKLIALVYKYNVLAMGVPEYMPNENLEKKKYKVKENFEESSDIYQVVDHSVNLPREEISEVVDFPTDTLQEVDMTSMERSNDGNKQSEEIF